MVLFVVIVILSFVIWCGRNLSAFVRAEEIIKNEQWEEEKMVCP